MNICFVLTSDSVNVDKPPMVTVFTAWHECCSHVSRWFPEIKELDVFDDVITCEGISYSNETMTVNIKAGQLRGKL